MIHNLQAVRERNKQDRGSSACVRRESQRIVSICLLPCYSCTWRRTSRRATSTWATVWRVRWSAAARRPTPSRWPTSRWYGDGITRRRTRTRIPPSVRPHPRSLSVGTASITRSWEGGGERAKGRREEGRCTSACVFACACVAQEMCIRLDGCREGVALQRKVGREFPEMP